MLKGCKGKKKSQITIFIIVAIIIVGLIIGMFSFAKNSNKSFGATTAPGVMNELTIQRDKCINDLTIEALDLYGLNQNKISSHLNSGFSNCILPVIKGYNRQFDINYTSPIITSSVNNEQIKISLDMTLSVGKDGEIERIEGKQWIHLRTISMNLNSDSNCILKNDAALVSFDEKFDMHISKGTKATKADGSCLDKITLTMKDPQIDYGGREKSYTSIAYVMGPTEARFDKDIIVKQKYSLKDYTDYTRAALASNSYVLPENWMKIQYYDATNKNYYVYPAEVTLAPDTYTNKKVITSKINQFYGAQLAIDSSCNVLKNIVIESPDRRVSLKLNSGTIATNSDRSCVSKIEIKEGPKTSKVVNFGDRDYQLLPGGATFSPEIVYTYRYTQKQIQNPVFLYGAQNWKDIINDNWTSPVEDYAPYLTINSPEENSTVLKGEVDFNFRATDDITSQLNCSLFINYVKQNSSIITSGTNTKITAKLDKEGPYNYFIQCSDGLNVGETDVITIEVVNSSSISLTGLAIKELNDVKYSISNKITGKVIANSNSSILILGGNGRVPSDLRIAHYDNGVYRPWPTTVDETNKLVIAKMNRFNGKAPSSSSITGNAITGFDIFGWDCFGACGDDDKEGINIVAQGCTDSNYGLIGLSKIDNSNNCTAQIGAVPSVKTNTYKIINDQACFEKEGAFTIIPSTSAGDTQGTITYDGASEVSTTSGPHTMSEEVLKEANGAPASSAMFGDVCAFTDLYLHMKGIGFKSEINSKTISAEEYAAGLNASGGFDIAKCSTYTTQCEIEVCAKCVDWSKGPIPDSSKGTMSSLENCVSVVKGECNGWNVASCSKYSGCFYEACAKCAGWAASDPGAIGSGTMQSLDYCTQAIEPECSGTGGGTTVAYQAATCSANTGGYKSSAGIIGYMVGDWWKINPVELANQLSSNGLSYTYVELLSDPYNSVTKPEIQLPKFKAYVEAMRAKNITTLVNLVHGKLNDGEGDYICKPAFGDAYFNNILNYVNNTIGPNKVIIGANHEWVGGCQDRRNSEISTLLSYGTPAEKMFYMSAKGSNYYMAIHSAPDETFPSGALNVMDGGDILKMTSTVNSDGSISAVSNKLEAYAKSVIACGSGIIYYGYAQKSIDTTAIQALGRAKSG